MSLDPRIVLCKGMDFVKLRSKFQSKIRTFYQMKEDRVYEELAWLQSQPRLPMDVERGILRTLREVLPPETPGANVPQILGLSATKRNCFDGMRYVGVLGEGVSGKVHLVQIGARYFALKEIPIHMPDDARILPKYKNEIALTKKAGDAGIGPKLYDAYYCDGHLFLRMEYIEGRTLIEWEDNHLIDEDLRKSLKKLVKKMHQLGIAHQDLHMNNIMVIEDEFTGKRDLKIIDYGRAVTRDTLIPLENEQVELFLDMFKLPDETQARRWALYRLVQEGVITVPADAFRRQSGRSRASSRRSSRSSKTHRSTKTQASTRSVTRAQR